MICRTQVDLMRPFKAPRNLTFGFQAKRNAFSVWYQSSDSHDCSYIIVATGAEADGEIVASCVMDDGFHVWHLVRQSK